MIVERACAALANDANFVVLPQETRDYDDGTRTRADVHLSVSARGGHSVVVDSKYYESSNLSKKEVEKTIRDATLARATGAVLVVANKDKVTRGAQELADRHNVQIVEANRNLPSNLKFAVASVIANNSVAAPAVRLNQDGSVNKNSGAVRNGSLLLTADNKVDKRSAAVRSGDVIVKQDGQPSFVSKATHAHVTPTAASAVASLGVSVSAVKSFETIPSSSSASSSSRTYETGPRGGVYYVNDNGNKCYVSSGGQKK